MPRPQMALHPIAVTQRMTESLMDRRKATKSSPPITAFHASFIDLLADESSTQGGRMGRVLKVQQKEEVMVSSWE